MTRELPLWLEPNTGDPTILYEAQQDRTLFDALLTNAGVMTEGALQVSQRGAGANYSVDVAAGWCAVAGTSIAYQGKYMCRSTAVENVGMTGPPGTGTRIDSVYARVYDDQADGSGQKQWTLESVAGTTLPANSLLLAQVTRTAGESSIVNSSISDQRVLAHAFNSDQVTTVGAILGLGTFNPSKIRKRITGYVEVVLSAFGAFTLPIPVGTSAVLGVQIQPAVRVTGGGSPQQTQFYTTLRLDTSNIAGGIAFTCWDKNGNSLNGQHVAYVYDLTYQQ